MFRLRIYSGEIPLRDYRALPIFEIFVIGLLGVGKTVHSNPRETEWRRADLAFCGRATQPARV